ncbi:MAG: hypothetical protein ACU0B1_02875 [Thermohalobaculum sp.]
MLTKSILTATAIALTAGIGSYSAGEKFATLEGISAVALAPSAMMSVRGAHLLVDVLYLTSGKRGRAVLLDHDVFGDHDRSWPGGDIGINTAEPVGKTPIEWNHP